MIKCEQCKFWNNGKCTYPSKIGADEYIIKDGKIIACKKFQLKKKSR